MYSISVQLYSIGICVAFVNPTTNRTKATQIDIVLLKYYSHMWSTLINFSV